MITKAQQRLIDQMKRLNVNIIGVLKFSDVKRFLNEDLKTISDCECSISTIEALVKAGKLEGSHPNHYLYHTFYRLKL